MAFVTGSEPVLRDDESACEVTGYVYLTALGFSPSAEPERAVETYRRLGYDKHQTIKERRIAK